VKLLSLFLLGLAGCFAQTTNLTVTFTLNNATIADAYLWNHGIPGTPTSCQCNPAFSLTLTSAITAAQTSITVAGSTTGMAATGVLVIDAEAMPYSAVSGQTITVARTAAQQTATAVHAAAATVGVELYPTPGNLIGAILTMGVQQVAGQLGALSNLYGPSITAKNAAAAALAAVSIGTGQ
jgi:hypothetical protein